MKTPPRFRQDSKNDYVVLGKSFIETHEQQEAQVMEGDYWTELSARTHTRDKIQTLKYMQFHRGANL